MTTPRRPSNRTTAVLVAVLVVCLAASAALLFYPSKVAPEPVALDELLDGVADGAYERVSIDDDTRQVTAENADGERFIAQFSLGASRLVAERVIDADVKVEAIEPYEEPIWRTLGIALVPVLVLAGVLVYILNKQGSGLGAFLNHKVVEADVPQTRFSDVAGIDEVVDELGELVAYLEDPSRWDELGATPPAGVLLAGAPGTGKTLLARAIAGEAGVPFFSLSGSSFVELFVGVGARRVREVFATAAKSERSIVFIDELDAVGKHRTSGANGGASEERENTLNELLVQLDGFASRRGVLVIGATNRPDVLDPALTRPKRFDRTIVVPPPDRTGRGKILDVHARGKALADDVDLELTARRTAGFTGAQLENVVNQAAREAVRSDASAIAQEHFDQAVATIMLGRERRSADVLDRDREVTAWHEAGHAVVALALDELDDPVQVSIVPRGPSGGQTWLAGNDHAFVSAPNALAQLAMAMGGRAAEVLRFDDAYTQGAAGDLQAATRLATQMAAEWGMSRLGPVFIDADSRAFGAAADRLFSTVSQMLVDAQMDAAAVLDAHEQQLAAVAEALLDRETIAGDELREIFDAATPAM